MSENLRFSVRPEPVEGGGKPFNGSTSSPRTAFQNKAVLFDMDGTLHKEDAFGAFIQFMIKSRPMVGILLSPIWLMGLLLYRLLPDNKMGVDLMLMAVLIGLTDKQLNRHIQHFIATFKTTYTPFNIIQNKLEYYLNNDYQVFIITGTPIIIAQALYPNWHNDQHNDKVHWLGSEFNNGRFKTLKVRCFAGNKVVLLNEYLKEHGLNCQFIAGFSDSKHDLPMMNLCDEKYWVDKLGNINTSGNTSGQL